jgi:hypothetical protein
MAARHPRPRRHRRHHRPNPSARYATKPISDRDVIAITEAIVNIRSYFMPRRAKQKY